MSVNLQNDYSTYVDKYKAVWTYLKKNSVPYNKIIEDLCDCRKYFGGVDSWSKFFNGEIAFVTQGEYDVEMLAKPEFKDLGLFSENGYFLLEGRFILPVKDMLGNVIALIGWYPDEKRYITTPSKYFSRDCLFFGMEQLLKTGLGKAYFIVEGVFDALSLRKLGYNALSNMGVASSYVKKQLYGLFSKLVFISDCDKTGKKVLNKDTWSMPLKSSFFRWTGNYDYGEGEEQSIKDIDLFCMLFDENDVRAVLDECLSYKGSIYTLIL